MVLRSVVKTNENMCTKLKKSIACRGVPIMWNTAVRLGNSPESADQALEWLVFTFEPTQCGSNSRPNNYLYWSIR